MLSRRSGIREQPWRLIRRDRSPRAPPKAAEWIGKRERGSTQLLRLMAFVSMRLEERISRIPLYGIALYFFLFAPSARRQSRRYLRRALGRRPTALDRFRHVLNFATTIHDRVYLINEQIRQVRDHHRRRVPHARRKWSGPKAPF
jgi:predicted LPLAT superfamily acyltransferase